jgi:hypothetical protein
MQLITILVFLLGLYAPIATAIVESIVAAPTIASSAVSIASNALDLKKVLEREKEKEK